MNVEINKLFNYFDKVKQNEEIINLNHISSNNFKTSD